MVETLQNGYIQVGAGCGLFDSKITIDNANEVRDAVALDFFQRVPVKIPEFSDTDTKMMYGKYFRSSPDELEMNVSSMFAGVVLRNMDQEIWRLVIMQSKSRRARYNNAPQRVQTRMVIEVIGDEVVEAVKRVRAVRGVGELAVPRIENRAEWEVLGEGRLTLAEIDAQIVRAGTAELLSGEPEIDFEVDGIKTQHRAYERYMTPEDCGDTIEFLTRVAKRAAA